MWRVAVRIPPNNSRYLQCWQNEDGLVAVMWAEGFWYQQALAGPISVLPFKMRSLLPKYGLQAANRSRFTQFGIR